MITVCRAGTEPFFLQWHLTDRCNLQCGHCYREAEKSQLSLADLRRVFDNFLELRRCLPQDKARVQIAGGEPLLSPHLFSVLKMISAAGIQSRVLSNGTLIDEHVAREMRSCGCGIVQISIDGTSESHDALRGQGTFDKAIAAADLLRAHGIQVTFQVVLSRANAQQIEALFAIAVEHADRLGFSRLVPCGAGASLLHEMLSPRELLEAFRHIRTLKRAHPKLQVPLRDPLWHSLAECLHLSRDIGGCSAGCGGICVDSDGSVYPCRRLPIVIGNAVRDSLVDLWQTPLMTSLRNRDRLGAACGKCQLRWQCGGCRAIPYALSGDPLGADPQCFYRPTLYERFLRAAAARVAAALDPDLGGG
jgi:AdoMet-dependent heme synthase